MRAVPVMLAACAFALFAGCGDSSESESTPTVAGSSGTTAAGVVTVTLSDYSLSASTSLKSGAVSFAINNVDSGQHEFVVMKGKFGELPKMPNGAVDEAKLTAGVLIGRTATISGGGSTTATYTLDAGNYVLLCNINSGPNSHARDGQRLDVTVA